MINAQLLKLLNDEASGFIANIQENLRSTGTDATGESSRSLHYEITEEGAKVVLTVLGKPFFAVVETGRKPTPNKKPSPEMIDNLTKWLSVRGKSEVSAWAIATKINKEGTDLWKKGGRTDIYSDLKEGFVDKIFIEVTENLASELFRKAEMAFT